MHRDSKSLAGRGFQHFGVCEQFCLKNSRHMIFFGFCGGITAATLVTRQSSLYTKWCKGTMGNGVNGGSKTAWLTADLAVYQPASSQDKWHWHSGISQVRESSSQLIDVWTWSVLTSGRDGCHMKNFANKKPVAIRLTIEWLYQSIGSGPDGGMTIFLDCSSSMFEKEALVQVHVNVWSDQ